MVKGLGLRVVLGLFVDVGDRDSDPKPQTLNRESVA